MSEEGKLSNRLKDLHSTLRRLKGSPSTADHKTVLSSLQDGFDEAVRLEEIEQKSPKRVAELIRAASGSLSEFDAAALKVACDLRGRLNWIVEWIATDNEYDGRIDQSIKLREGALILEQLLRFSNDDESK